MIRNTVKDFESIRMTDFLKLDADDLSEQTEKPAPSLIDKPFNEVEFVKWACEISENLGDAFSLSVDQTLYKDRTSQCLYLHALNSFGCSIGVLKNFSFWDGRLNNPDQEDDFRQFEKDILSGKYK